MDEGIELVRDDVRTQLNRQARQVYIKAILFAGAVTVIAVAIPHR
jgi:hypothetical protein